MRLTLNAGDMLIFRGDLVHGGAAFDKLNVRVHFYLDVPGEERTSNTTNYMLPLDGFYNIGPRK